MAQFSLTSFLDIGTKGYHTATSWKVCYDRAGNNIIDQSLVDSVNLLHWISPLPDGQGNFHADLAAMYLFVKVHILNDTSPWFYAGVGNQNEQTFQVTNNGNLVQTVNMLIDGIKNYPEQGVP